MLFSEKIKCLMRRNGITQRELADKIGVNQPTVSRWFNGQMPYSKAIKLLSSEFKIPAEFFFNDNLTEEEFISKLNQFYTEKTVKDLARMIPNQDFDSFINQFDRLYKINTSSDKKELLRSFLSLDSEIVFKIAQNLVLLGSSVSAAQIFFICDMIKNLNNSTELAKRLEKELKDN